MATSVESCDGIECDLEGKDPFHSSSLTKNTKYIEEAQMKSQHGRKALLLLSGFIIASILASFLGFYLFFTSLRMKAIALNLSPPHTNKNLELSMRLHSTRGFPLPKLFDVRLSSVQCNIGFHRYGAGSEDKNIKTSSFSLTEAVIDEIKLSELLDSDINIYLKHTNYSNIRAVVGDNINLSIIPMQPKKRDSWLIFDCSIEISLASKLYTFITLDVVSPRFGFKFQHSPAAPFDFPNTLSSIAGMSTSSYSQKANSVFTSSSSSSSTSSSSSSPSNVPKDSSVENARPSIILNSSSAVIKWINKYCGHVTVTSNPISFSIDFSSDSRYIFTSDDILLDFSKEANVIYYNSSASNKFIDNLTDSGRLSLLFSATQNGTKVLASNVNISWAFKYTERLDVDGTRATTTKPIYEAPASFSPSSTSRDLYETVSAGLEPIRTSKKTSSNPAVNLETVVDCYIHVTSKASYAGNPTYSDYFLNNVKLEAASGQSNGFNVAKVTTSPTGECEMSVVALGLNMFTDATGNSNRLISAMNSLAIGEIGVVSITDTGSGIKAAAIQSLQQTLGAQVTGFPYRNSYVLIGQKGTGKLCEVLPTNNIVSCSITASYTPTPTALPTLSPKPTSVPTIAPTPRALNFDVVSGPCAANTNCKHLICNTMTTIIVAEGGWSTKGGIYVSQDAGSSFSIIGYNDYWDEISCRDTTVVVSAYGCVSGSNTGMIVVSSDSGLTWSIISPNARGYRGAAASSDLMYLFGMRGGTNCNFDLQTFVSSNYGVTWSTLTEVKNWETVCTSASGQNVVAGSGNSQSIVRYSSNYGLSWNTMAGLPANTFSPNRYGEYSNALCSDDGKYVYITSGFGLLVSSTFGQSGAISTNSVVLQFIGLVSIYSTAMSSEGKYIILAGSNLVSGYVCYSLDYGGTWRIVEYFGQTNIVDVSYDPSTKLVYVITSQSVIKVLDFIQKEPTPSPTMSPSISTQPTSRPTYNVVPEIATSNSWDGPLGSPVTDGRNWNCIATDSSGRYAVAGSNSGGGVWFSTNYGQQWTQSTGAPGITIDLSSNSCDNYYQSIASSATGRIVVAGGYYESPSPLFYTSFLYVSCDFGNSFSLEASFTPAVAAYIELGGVSIKADGTRIIISVHTQGVYLFAVNKVTGVLTKLGSTITAAATYNVTMALSVSSDSSFYNLVFSVKSGGIFYSRDAGSTWLRSDAPTASITNWFCIAASSTGRYLAIGTFSNGIYYSNNYGATWIQSTGAPAASNSNYFGISSSATGKTMLSAYHGGSEVYISTNYGEAWIKVSTVHSASWTGVAISNDGGHMYACASNNAAGGGIYVSYAVPTSQPSSQPSRQPLSRPTAVPTMPSYSTFITTFEKSALNGAYRVDLGLPHNAYTNSAYTFSCIKCISCYRYLVYFHKASTEVSNDVFKVYNNLAGQTSIPYPSLPGGATVVYSNSGSRDGTIVADIPNAGGLGRDGICIDLQTSATGNSFYGLTAFIFAQCASGQFFNQTIGACSFCPRNTYSTHLYGSLASSYHQNLFCKPCQNGQTAAVGSTSCNGTASTTLFPITLPAGSRAYAWETAHPYIDSTAQGSLQTSNIGAYARCFRCNTCDKFLLTFDSSFYFRQRLEFFNADGLKGDNFNLYSSIVRDAATFVDAIVGSNQTSYTSRSSMDYTLAINTMYSISTPSLIAGKEGICLDLASDESIVDDGIHLNMYPLCSSGKYFDVANGTCKNCPVNTISTSLPFHQNIFCKKCPYSNGVSISPFTSCTNATGAFTTTWGPEKGYYWDNSVHPYESNTEESSNGYCITCPTCKGYFVVFSPMTQTEEVLDRFNIYTNINKAATTWEGAIASPAQLSYAFTGSLGKWQPVSIDNSATVNRDGLCFSLSSDGANNFQGVHLTVHPICPCGQFIDISGVSAVCIPCAIGSYSVYIASIANFECEFCPVGTGNSATGSCDCSVPSSQPSNRPSVHPSRQPESRPSMQPSRLPSSQPSRQPIAKPSMQPSRQPSRQPSVQPSVQPSSHPSNPSRQPSSQPTDKPDIPSSQPSMQPSTPTALPSTQPSAQPFRIPTSQPSKCPSAQPSRQPFRCPSTSPSSQPSRYPSMQPSSFPTLKPSSQPSCIPSMQPSLQPSMQPTMQPFSQPSSAPSIQPSRQPSRQPVSFPSGLPTNQPSTQPFRFPSSQPSQSPTKQPSAQPSSKPTPKPTPSPSVSFAPTISFNPTSSPSLMPSYMSLPLQKSKSNKFLLFAYISGAAFIIIILFVAGYRFYTKRNTSVKPLDAAVTKKVIDIDENDFEVGYNPKTGNWQNVETDNKKRRISLTFKGSAVAAQAAANFMQRQAKLNILSTHDDNDDDNDEDDDDDTTDISKVSESDSSSDSSENDFDNDDYDDDDDDDDDKGYNPKGNGWREVETVDNKRRAGFIVATVRRHVDESSDDGGDDNKWEDD